MTDQSSTIFPFSSRLMVIPPNSTRFPYRPGDREPGRHQVAFDDLLFDANGHVPDEATVHRHGFLGAVQAVKVAAVHVIDERGAVVPRRRVETSPGADPLQRSSRKFRVVVDQILLAVTSLFNHANVRLPFPVGRVLRWFVVTPAMHSVHHSADRADRDTNFGFSIPWWDRLFGTYRTRASSERPVVGMPELQFQTRQTLRWMLALPFRSGRSRPATASRDLQRAA